MDGMTNNWSSGANFSVPEADEQQGPPTVSDEATSKIFDPVTAAFVRDTPSPSDVMKAIAATPVINPLAIMRGQQTGSEILPSVIMKAQRASAMKERAQLLALLQDAQAHEMRKATIQNQQDRLAWDMMKQQAAQGNAAIGAVYKTFSDLAPNMDPQAANQWLDEMMKGDISQGLPDEAAGRMFALQTLQKTGGIQPKGPKAANAPSGFEYTPEGNLQVTPGGPEDVSVIRAQAQARHVESGGGIGGFFAPGMTITSRQYMDESGNLITESVPMGVMRPKGAEPYAVPLRGVPESTKMKPAEIPEKLRTDYVQTIGILQSARQSFETLKHFAPSILERTATSIAGVPLTPEAGAADSARQALLFSIAKLAEQGALQQPDREVAEGMVGRIFDPRVGAETRRATMGEFDRWLQSRERANQMRIETMSPVSAPVIRTEPTGGAVMTPAAPNIQNVPTSSIPTQPAAPQSTGKVRKFNPMTGRVE